METLIEEIGSAVISVLKKNKALNYILIRDEEIKSLYRQLRRTGKTAKEARAEIAERTFTDQHGNSYKLGDKAIQKVIYGGK